jgi:hypothetical protein
MFLSEQPSLMRASSAFLLLARVTVLMIALGSLFACSSMNTMIGGNTQKDAISNAVYLPDPNGISIRLKAVKNLNFVNQEAHTLAVAVVQVDSVKAAMKLAQNPDSLDKLLVGEAANDPSVTAYDRFIVQPSSSDEVVLARAQETQIIIIYAAYFNALIENRIRLQEIPLLISSKGIVAQTYQAKAAPLNIRLNLGDTAIAEMTVPKDELGADQYVFKNSNNPTLNSAIPILKSTAQGVMGL